MYPYALQGDNLSIVINFKTHTISRGSHPNFDRIVNAIREGAWAEIPDLVDVSSAVAKYVGQTGSISVRNGGVYYNDRPVGNVVVDRILKMIEEGFNPKPLMAFLDNLMRNPSRQTVQELYLFLESGMMPLTEDGCFLAFKKVRATYFDIHSNSVPNMPYSVFMQNYPEGKVVVGAVTVLANPHTETVMLSMPRNEVDDVRDRTCSNGLHFCSLDYLPKFSSSGDDRVMIVKINPADVVSIPSDYNNTKGRTCAYTIVGEHNPEERIEKAFTTSVDTRYSTPITPENSVPDRRQDEDDYEDLLDDLLQSDRPREVYRDAYGYRYADDGTFASRGAYDAWVDYRDNS